MYDELKEQLFCQYPFLQKTGKIAYQFQAEEIFRKYKGEKLLVLVVGVYGAERTTYCQQNFASYPVVNLDKILSDYLEKYPCFTEEDTGKVNRIMLRKVTKELRKRKFAIVDFEGTNFLKRVCFLNALQGKYTKVILLLVNPPFEQIQAKLLGQVEQSWQSDLLEDVFLEYQLVEIQRQEHFLEMGMDEVYFI